MSTSPCFGAGAGVAAFFGAVFFFGAALRVATFFFGAAFDFDFDFAFTFTFFLRVAMAAQTS